MDCCECGRLPAHRAIFYFILLFLEPRDNAKRDHLQASTDEMVVNRTAALLANTTLAAILGTVFAVVAVFTGIARVRAGTGGRIRVE